MSDPTSTLIDNFLASEIHRRGMLKDAGNLALAAKTSEQVDLLRRWLDERRRERIHIAVKTDRDGNLASMEITRTLAPLPTGGEA